MMRQLLVAIVLDLFVLHTAGAATLCATNGAELVAALSTARTNGQADVIRLTSGFFVHPSSGTYSFSPTIAENYDIEISGGWSEFFGNPCGQQLAGDTAFSSIILSGSTVRVMNIEPPANSSMDVTIKRVLFFGGNSGAEGSGLRIYPFVGYTGRIIVENAAFSWNTGTNGAALRILSPGTIYVRNSVFIENHSEGGLSVASIWAFNPAGRIYFTNNTVIDNDTTISSSTASSGVEVRVDSGARALLANNNLWGNEAHDLRLVGDGAPLVRNNNIGAVIDFVGAISTGNLSVEPVYIGEFNEYTPAPGSPLIDAGTKPRELTPIPVPFEDAWSLGSVDVLQRSRVQGVRVDIGAYEARPTNVFKSGFE